MNSKWGMRGFIPVAAQGPTRFAKVSLEFMEVMRTLVTLRLLWQYTWDIEEVCWIFGFWDY